MADLHYSFIDGHESINQTMRYLEKKYLKASIAHKEALQNRDMLLAERERRVARYFEALIDAEAHIQAAKVHTDEEDTCNAESWDSLFRRHLQRVEIVIGDEPLFDNTRARLGAIGSRGRLP